MIWHFSIYCGQYGLCKGVSFTIILRIFANIAKCCVVVVLRLSIFDAYRLFAYFTKVCAQKSPYFFHFFQTIASCDHQLTSEGQLQRPLACYWQFLMFSYDFDNVIFANLIYFDNYILFCTNFILILLAQLSLALACNLFSTPTTNWSTFVNCFDHSEC